MKSSSRVALPLAPTPPRFWVRYSASGVRFDIAQVRNGDDHLVVGVEILRVELFGSVNDLRAPFVAVFGLHLQQFVLNDLHLQFAAAQHIVEISDLRLQLVALGNQLVVFESRQSA